jgi:hypothetical protein
MDGSKAAASGITIESGITTASGTTGPSGGIIMPPPPLSATAESGVAPCPPPLSQAAKTRAKPKVSALNFFIVVLSLFVLLFVIVKLFSEILMVNLSPAQAG